MRKKTDGEFIKEVIQLVGDEYSFLEPYSKSNVKIKVRHNTCGHTYKISPNSFLRGRRCNMCFGNEGKRKTTEEFSREVYELVSDEYTVLGEYVNRSTNILMRHERCGREYEVQPGNFLNKSRCVECYYESLRLSDEEISKKVADAIGNSYRYICREYKDTIKVLHEDCGRFFTAKMSDIFLKKTHCKLCSSSTGEAYVRYVLDKLSLDYQEQVSFDNLKHISRLTYDFYIPSTRTLIEYQGIQHYKPTSFGSVSEDVKLKNFGKQQLHDRLKRDFAKSNDMKLVEVPYTDDTLIKVENTLLSTIYI